jgi:hypothetical protein
VIIVVAIEIIPVGSSVKDLGFVVLAHTTEAIMNVWWRAHANARQVTALTNFRAALFARHPVMLRTKKARYQYLDAWKLWLF